jgi:isochorismate pyruvate lyase
VLQAARFKPDAADIPAPGRVEEVIQNVLQLAREHGAIPELVEKTYRAMIAGLHRRRTPRARQYLENVIRE